MEAFQNSVVCRGLDKLFKAGIEIGNKWEKEYMQFMNLFIELDVISCRKNENTTN